VSLRLSRMRITSLLGRTSLGLSRKLISGSERSRKARLGLDRPNCRNLDLGKSRIEFKVNLLIIEFINMSSGMFSQMRRSKKTCRLMDMEFLKNQQRLLLSRQKGRKRLVF